MIVALTHGAGSNCESALLKTVDEALSAAGIQAVRYDLPFRVVQHKTPMRGDAERDRAGIRALVERLHSEHPKVRIIAGGHSYGGRQTTMLAAEDPALIDGLLLLSYPLHPPRKREELRTAHFPNIRTPVLFVHGTRDPFGLPEEMQAAMELISAPKRLILIEGAGHDLMRRGAEIGPQIAQACTEFFT